MGALFDLTFSKFIAPTIAKIVYVLIMIGIAITYLTFVAVAFKANGALGIAVLIIIGPLASLLYLVFARIVLEAFLAQIVTAQNTAVLVGRSGGQPAGPGSAEAAADAPGGPEPHAL